jgi:hypothetical protein
MSSVPDGVFGAEGTADPIPPLRLSADGGSGVLTPQRPTGASGCALRGPVLASIIGSDNEKHAEPLPFYCSGCLPVLLSNHSSASSSAQ